MGEAHQRGLSGAPRAVRAIEDGGRGACSRKVSIFIAAGGPLGVSKNLMVHRTIPPGERCCRCRLSRRRSDRRVFSQPDVGGCANARVRRLWSSTPGRPSGTAPRDTRPIFIAGRVGIPRTVNLLSGSAQQELRWRYLSDLSAASPLIASDLL